MNWGTKIVISLGVFIAFIASLGIFMMISNDEKVEKDYYERDLMYEKEIQAQRNAQSLSAEVVLDITDIHLIFSFPKEIKEYQGKILFLRPDNAQKDQTFEMKLEKNQMQKIEVMPLQKGLWKIQAQWQMNGKLYQSKVFEWIKY
ncbi:MAG: FixH family protein [Raineya sp.]|jgi:nitrogen fixation protein FixH|nr:FixH family protein [Raineya sp.]